MTFSPNTPASAGTERLASVVRLDDYRRALLAADFLRGVLHDPPGLDKVVVEAAETGGFQVVVCVRQDEPALRACLPRTCNGAGIVMRVASPRPAEDLRTDEHPWSG